MKIEVITPAPAHARNGNRMTALRYARILRQLGHEVTLEHRYSGAACDLMIALHARRSSESIRRFAKQNPESPLIVVLTGTDLYRDIRTSPAAKKSLELATRLVVLQELGLGELPEQLHPKTRVIYQSAQKFRGSVKRPTTYFRVSVIGHLRPEKDPFRAARAIRQLPSSSRARVIQIGRALSRHTERLARRENASNPRYRWLGELPHWKTRRVLAASHLLTLTSRMEGSSNVLSEALASSVPVVASRIPGLIGTLGEDYPAYFPVGDAGALSRLILRAESDEAFYRELKSRCSKVAPLVEPKRELESWKQLIREFTGQ